MKRVGLMVLMFNCVLAFGQSLPVYVPGSGLLAWYPFSGNAYDSSGHGFHGVVSGAVLTSDRHGNPNACYSFNGTSSVIQSMLVPPVGDAPRTISCWFKYDSPPTGCDGGYALAGYGGTTSACSQARKNFSLEVNNYYGPPEARVDGICIAQQQSGDTLDDSWHFFAAVYSPLFGDFNTVKLYVDGEYKATTPLIYTGTTTMNTDSLSRFQIGKGHYECERYFKGRIDDIGVWDKALSEGQLFGLHMGSPIAGSSNLLAYVMDSCASWEFAVIPVNFSSTQFVKTYFGDGSTQVDTFSAASEFVRFHHVYSVSGTYTVKHVLYDGGLPADSVTFTKVFSKCHVLPLRLYYDGNADCVHASTESFLLQPSLLRVDSSGIAVDTLSATSGVNYWARGPVGSVYSFQVIESIPGLIPTCPPSASVSYVLDTVHDTVKYLGFDCSATPGFDLKLFTSFRAGPHHFGGLILASNAYCTPPAATITMHLNPKYNSLLDFVPPPTSIVGNLVNWDVSTLSSALSSSFLIYANMEGSASIGDTLMTRYVAEPTAADANVSDNIVIRIDTVKSGYDPNDIQVQPAGCLERWDELLTYTIRFENTGNDTAFNIYILDTLPATLDGQSLRLLAVSAPMNISMTPGGGGTIVRFDFPNINLLDSSHHGLCEGMVVFSVRLKGGLSEGTVIGNRAGIYFDTNPVVATNTEVNIIGCPELTDVSTNLTGDVRIYPNPAHDFLMVQADTKRYLLVEISNLYGQLMLTEEISRSSNRLDISSLPAGVYVVTMRGNGGRIVKKIIRL